MKKAILHTNKKNCIKINKLDGFLLEITIDPLDLTLLKAKIFAEQTEKKSSMVPNRNVAIIMTPP